MKKVKTKKQKIPLPLLKILNLPMPPSQRRLSQSKRKLKRPRHQPLRLQRLTIKLLRHQKPPKQRLLQLPPSLPQLKRKKLPQPKRKMLLQLIKLQLLKRRFKLKPMLKKAKASLNLTLILTHLTPTPNDHYCFKLFIIFKKFSHCKMWFKI